MLVVKKHEAGGNGLRMERDKMLAGELYDALDPDLVRDRDRARDLCQALNATANLSGIFGGRFSYSFLARAVIPYGCSLPSSVTTVPISNSGSASFSISTTSCSMSARS